MPAIIQSQRAFLASLSESVYTRRTGGFVFEIDLALLASAIEIWSPVIKGKNILKHEGHDPQGAARRQRRKSLKNQGSFFPCEPLCSLCLGSFSQIMKSPNFKSLRKKMKP
jgi:hypothetical protein